MEKLYLKTKPLFDFLHDCFYEKGMVLEKKRLPYSEIKDVVFVAATSEKKFTLKQAARDMGVLWIYPKKGAVIGLREINYQFDNVMMEKIKKIFLFFCSYFWHFSKPPVL